MRQGRFLVLQIKELLPEDFGQNPAKHEQSCNVDSKNLAGRLGSEEDETPRLDVRITKSKFSI